MKNNKQLKKIKMPAPSYFAGGFLDIAMAGAKQLGKYAGAIQEIANPTVDPNQGDYKFNWGNALTGGGILQELAKKISTDNARSKYVMGGSPGNYAKGGMISKSKAREILHDGTVHGKPITEKQRRFFGYMATRKATGGQLDFPFLDMNNDPGNKNPTKPSTKQNDSQAMLATPYYATRESTAMAPGVISPIANPMPLSAPIQDLLSYDFVTEAQGKRRIPLPNAEAANIDTDRYLAAMALRKTDYDRFVAAHNNPLNLMYGPYTQSRGARPGRKNSHGTLAMFPTLEEGWQAAYNKLKYGELYTSKTLDEALKTWSGWYVKPKPGKERSGYGADRILPSAANKIMKDLTDEELGAVIKKMAQWEDGRTFDAYYNQGHRKDAKDLKYIRPIGKAYGGSMFPQTQMLGRFNMINQPQTIRALLTGNTSMPMKDNSFAMGGNIGSSMNSYATGGDMKISDSSFVVDGNPSITDGNYYPQLNVKLDHGEVVKDNFVYSNKLKDPNTNITFAKLAKPVEKSTGKSENYLRKFPNDPITTKTVNMNNMYLSKLKDSQEVLAGLMGLRTDQPQGMAYGGMVKGYVSGGDMGDPTNPNT